VGLVPHRRLLRYLAERESNPELASDVTVKDIMIADPVSVAPETTTVEAIALMRDRSIGALPVVREGQLVGMVTEADFARIAGKILDQTLARGPGTQ
jgi:CBS domain-containing protein